MRRFHWMTIPLILAVAASVSCGGGGDSSTNPAISTYAGGFTPAEPNPGANSVSMSGSASANIVTLVVGVAGTNDVSGASFDVTFDPAMAEFVNWSAGQLLEQGGHQVTYQLNSVQPGRVVVGVSRTTIGAGANAGISMPIILLRMRVTKPGASAVGFSNADLLNSSSPPATKSGITFSGGTLTAT